MAIAVTKAVLGQGAARIDVTCTWSYLDANNAVPRLVLERRPVGTTAWYATAFDGEPAYVAPGTPKVLTDYEPILNRASEYRARILRKDGTEIEASAAVAATGVPTASRTRIVDVKTHASFEVDVVEFEEWKSEPKASTVVLASGENVVVATAPAPDFTGRLTLLRDVTATADQWEVAAPFRGTVFCLCPDTATMPNMYLTATQVTVRRPSGLAAVRERIIELDVTQVRPHLRVGY